MKNIALVIPRYTEPIPNRYRTDTEPIPNMNPSPQHTFKISLVGDAKSGKTTFVGRHKTGEFETTHVPTLGCNVTELSFNTNYGTVKFDCWDTAGKREFMGLGNGYTVGAHACIVMFDHTSRDSYKHVPDWITKVRDAAPDVHIVVCGNKVDKSTDTLAEEMVVVFDDKIKYYDISVKNNYQYDKPFLSLARTLTGYGDLVFTPLPALEPPEIGVKKLWRIYDRF